MNKTTWAVGVLCLALAGCNTPHQIMDRSDFLAEGTRSYRGESKERILAAAETVLQHSDPGDWDFRHTIHGFTGLRRYVVYAVIAAAQGREKWEFVTEQAAPGEWNASVSVSEAGVSTGGYTRTPYEGKMASIPLYRLFWDRVDYVLARRDDWVTCEQAAAVVQAQNTSTQALGGLCGATSGGRLAPPPPQMDPVAPPAAATPRRRRVS